MTRPGADITDRSIASRGGLACALMGGLVLACAPGVGHAQSTLTPAATEIANIATLTFGQAPETTSLRSNRVSLQVQEILDVSVEVLTPEVQVEADTQDQRLAFRVRNLGNGPQAFDLSLTTVDGGFDPHACKIMIDWDGDGRYDAPRDRVSDTTPVLAPGGSVVAWVSCSIPATAAQGAWGRILLRAHPTVLRDGVTEGRMANAGNGGVYVVIGTNLRKGGTGVDGSTTSGGTTGGTTGTTGELGTTATGTFRIGQASAQLIKTQSVLDPAGGARAVPGAIVTYSLEARFGAGEAIHQVRITDAIPAGSTYVPGSLALDGAGLSDAVDDDAGRFSGAGIEVGLGDVSAPSRRVITFKVRINPLESAS